MNIFHSMSASVSSTLSSGGPILPSSLSRGASSNGLSEAIIGYRRPNVNQRQYLNKLMAQTRIELASKEFQEKM